MVHPNGIVNTSSNERKTFNWQLSEVEVRIETLLRYVLIIFQDAVVPNPPVAEVVRLRRDTEKPEFSRIRLPRGNPLWEFGATEIRKICWQLAPPAPFWQLLGYGEFNSTAQIKGGTNDDLA